MCHNLLFKHIYVYTWQGAIKKYQLTEDVDRKKFTCSPSPSVQVTIQISCIKLHVLFVFKGKNKTKLNHIPCTMEKKSICETQEKCY